MSRPHAELPTASATQEAELDERPDRTREAASAAEDLGIDDPQTAHPSDP